MLELLVFLCSCLMPELFLFYLKWQLHSSTGKLPFSVNIVKGSILWHLWHCKKCWISPINSMKNDLQKRMSHLLHSKKKKKQTLESDFK